MNHQELGGVLIEFQELGEVHIEYQVGEGACSLTAGATESLEEGPPVAQLPDLTCTQLEQCQRVFLDDDIPSDNEGADANAETSTETGSVIDVKVPAYASGPSYLPVPMQHPPLPSSASHLKYDFIPQRRCQTSVMAMQ